MPTLQELQATEAIQGGTRLRTLMLEFSDTLQRLPKLRQEVETWMQTPGVDWADLALRLEPQLATAAGWLLDYDMLSPSNQDDATLKDFMQRATVTVTSRTIATMVSKYQAAKQEADVKYTEGGFIDHGNGTVTDPRTCLMWKRLGEGTSRWYDALRFNGWNGLVNCGGFNDWRLPNIHELKSLLQSSSPYICDETFPDSRDAFWSLSPNDGNHAWYINFGDGSVSSKDRDYPLAVRLVRNSQ